MLGLEYEAVAFNLEIRLVGVKLAVVADAVDYCCHYCGGYCCDCDDCCHNLNCLIGETFALLVDANV